MRLIQEKRPFQRPLFNTVDMKKILQNQDITDSEWESISCYFPEEPEPSKLGGRPRLSNRIVFQAMLNWLADGLAKRRVKRYTGVGYDTLTARLDEWIEGGVFERLWLAALENHEYLCKLRLERLLVDGAINIAPNGGEATGKNPTDRARSGSKRSPLSDALGTPLGIVVAGANDHDSPLLGPTIDSSLVELEAGAEIDLDRAYRGYPTMVAAQSRGFKSHVPEASLRSRSRRYPIECLHQKFNLWRGIKIRVLRSSKRWLALLQLAAAFIVFRATSHRLATNT
jgi:putative transposase